MFLNRTGWGDERLVEESPSDAVIPRFQLAQADKIQMDVDLINPFIRSTSKVFQVMAGYPLYPGSVRAEKRLTFAPRDVYAMVVMGGGITGAAVLAFPEHVVLRIASAFAGEEVDWDGAMDALGELANMITGGAKQDFPGRLVTISIPAISVGAATMGGLHRLTPWLYVPFNGELGRFELAVSVS